MKVDRNTVRKWVRKTMATLQTLRDFFNQKKITPNTKARVKHLAVHEVTGLRSEVKKLNLFEDCPK